MSIHLEQEVAEYSERRLRLATAITDYADWLDRQHGIDAERTLRLADTASSLRQDKLVVVMAGYWLDGFPFALAGAKVWPVMLGLAAVRLVSLAVYMIIGLTLVRAVLSWVNSNTPLMPVVYELTEPFLRPLRRFIPMVANVDLTPLVLFILCQLILMVPVLALERALLGSL